MSLQIQNDLDELEQYGRCLSLTIDGIPVKKKERSQDCCMFEEAGAGNVDRLFIELIKLVKLTPIKSLQKNVVKFTGFQHPTIVYWLKRI